MFEADSTVGKKPIRLNYTLWLQNMQECLCKQFHLLTVLTENYLTLCHPSQYRCLRAIHSRWVHVRQASDLVKRLQHFPVIQDAAVFAHLSFSCQFSSNLLRFEHQCIGWHLDCFAEALNSQSSIIFSHSSSRGPNATTIFNTTLEVRRHQTNSKSPQKIPAQPSESSRPYGFTLPYLLKQIPCQTEAYNCDAS